MFNKCDYYEQCKVLRFTLKPFNPSEKGKFTFKISKKIHGILTFSVGNLKLNSEADYQLCLFR